MGDGKIWISYFHKVSVNAFETLGNVSNFIGWTIVQQAINIQNHVRKTTHFISSQKMENINQKAMQ